jgi:transcriptional regulator with XRE-family HTH domain
MGISKRQTMTPRSKALSAPATPAAVRKRIKLFMKIARLTQESLALDVGSTQGRVSEMLSGKRAIGTAMLHRIAGALKQPVAEIVGIDVVSLCENRTTQTDASEASPITSKFENELANVFGETLHDLSEAARRSRISPSCLSSLIPVCEATLTEMECLTSGPELEAVRPTLQTIIELADQAWEQEDALRIRQLLFEAHDKAVEFEVRVAPSRELRDKTETHFGKMALASVEDKSLIKRLYARRGDVLKIRGWKDPVLSNRALVMLRDGADHRRAPYFVLRSQAVLAARCRYMSEVDFKAIVQKTKDALQTDRFTPHEKAHTVDGLADTYADRYKSTGIEDYRLEALKHLELAEKEGARATRTNGTHVIFALRIPRLSVSLAQSGILDHLGPDENNARLKMLDLAHVTRLQAEEAGMARTVEDMTNLILELTGPSHA